MSPARAKPKPKSAPRKKAAPKTQSASRARARRGSAGGFGRFGLPVIEQRHLDLAGLGLVAAGVFFAFPLYLHWNGGQVGRGITHGLASLVGMLRYTAPVVAAAAGVLLVMRPVLPAVRPFRTGAVCLLSALALALAAGTFGLGPSGIRQGYFHHDFLAARGGLLGDGELYVAQHLLGAIGAHILAIFLLLAGVLLLTGASVAGVLKATATSVADTTRSLRINDIRAARGPERVKVPEPAGAEPTVGRIVPPELDGSLRYPDLYGDDVDLPDEPEDEPLPELEDDDEPVADEPQPEDAKHVPVVEPTLAYGEQAELEIDDAIDWRRPDATLLKRSPEAHMRPDTAGQQVVQGRLLEALAHFGIEAQIVGVVSGPHITRYELRLAPGIKMSKVAQMKDDLAYALAATDIRILAPIPGKQAVGVEVPNAKRRIVTLGDVFGEAPPGSSPLNVWLGKDVSGKAISADLAKMPHLLVAGTTGAGKSGAVNAMLSSILLRSTPDEVRLVLVDPKQVELNHYEAVPHLLTPVITSPRAAANALQNLVREMEWRYGIMSIARTRSLPELNKYREKAGEAKLPYILCVIDELADLMMVAPADVEDSIIRLAQKARAVGIHLVLATQSPRVDVITGMIKANVPSRIAFAVSSQTDSRVILDQNGAESLLGQGDMLFSPVGTSRLQRIQGAYIDEPQIERITAWWAEQGEPELREDLLEEVEPAEAKDGGGEDEGFDPDEDPLLSDAIELVVEMGTASTSMLQRRLRLGYTRAGRLIDMLERRGVISGYEGSKPRQVLVSPGDLPRVLAALAEKPGGGAAAVPGPDEPAILPPAPPPYADDDVDGDAPVDGPL